MREDNLFKALKLIFGHEGGYVNDPQDPGGETKFGIAKRYHPNVDIKNLTLSEAAEIYRTEYWEPAHCGDFPWLVAYPYFDTCVHSGVAGATKMMQRALGVVDDGVIGPFTKRAIEQKAHDPHLVAKFLAERTIYLASRSHWPRYARGWSRRLFEVMLYALRPELTEDKS